LVINAERAEVADESYDVTIVQDGLHHLRSPVQGFVEMLRIARTATIFLEPHQSLVGSLIGTKWEHNEEAVNYVFRWNRKLVHDVASSFLCSERFLNLSYSFWHHNIVFERVGRALGSGVLGLSTVKLIKSALDTVVYSAGNQFCGLVVKL
jgi:hypothetical protein